MSMCAEIIAVGRFRAELVPWLEYPEALYADTKVGAPVVKVIFGIAEGSTASIRFAQLVGIDDAWDFNQHKIDPTQIDFAALETFLKSLSGWVEGDYLADLQTLERFAGAGFDLYFLPNG
ncbi:MAG TPA: hypothetical protein VGG29_07350 [Caulobacteraceae bacterium]